MLVQVAHGLTPLPIDDPLPRIFIGSIHQWAIARVMGLLDGDAAYLALRLVPALGAMKALHEPEYTVIQPFFLAPPPMAWRIYNHTVCAFFACHPQIDFEKRAIKQVTDRAVILFAR